MGHTSRVHRRPHRLTEAQALHLGSSCLPSPPLPGPGPSGAVCFPLLSHQHFLSPPVLEPSLRVSPRSSHYNKVT